MENYNLSLEDMPNEVWKDIISLENRYQISNLGRVKGLKRLFYSKGNNTRTKKPQIIKPCILTKYEHFFI